MSSEREHKKSERGAAKGEDLRRAQWRENPGGPKAQESIVPALCEQHGVASKGERRFCRDEDAEAG